MVFRQLPLTVNNIDECRALVGVDIGPTDWRVITQEHIQAFADLTGDHQWIHVDEERASRSLHGSTLAHGLYVLALAPDFMASLLEFRGFSRSLNYGYNRVRFPAPIPVGSSIRMRAMVTAVVDVDGGADVVTARTYERLGSVKPVCVAENVGRYYE
ncbi:MaoC family dehydratase [Nocardia vermiculata]|uniref:MaoC family dehydratase n=1 Tax=Nocardia vermiculata TaxID=257274 RepID=A0A846Y0X4_9NOCA|nr:MaoC family dehydratase [Nocardia vermiculata]NKY51564.1 MaoC family dehydratase [Nocardia vermiculata]